MIGSTILFVAIAILTAILGATVPWQQGVSDIMIWLATVSLAVAAGFIFAHLGRYDPEE